MKLRYLIYTLFGAVSLLTGYAFYNDINLQNEISNEAEKKHCELSYNRLLQYLEAIDYPLDSCFNLFCSIDSLDNFKAISKKPRIGLYIDARQCTSCWKSEIIRMTRWNDSLHFENSPIIIANNFNLREIKIMQSETEFPIYSLGNVVDFQRPLTKFNTPFFFILNDGYISRPFFPSELENDVFPAKYLNHISAILKPVNPLNRNIENGDLKIYNPIVRLGKVDVRERKPIVYQLHNNNEEPCMIYNCIPSCSCVVVDSFSTSIPPGGDGFVAITTVQINKGEFKHSVNIQTNFQNQPYSVLFSGYCR